MSNIKSIKAAPRVDRPDTWPTIWRIVAPGAGGYGHDMVYAETEDEAEARRMYHAHLCSGHPVRLERVACGPLPTGADRALDRLRAVSPQNPGTERAPVLGLWTRETHS